MLSPYYSASYRRAVLNREARGGGAGSTMAESDSGPRWPVGDQAGWRLAYELLQAGKYERLAELLGEAQTVSGQTDDASRAQILAAARRISLACSQCQAETTWHQQAHQAAGQRERELKGQLRAILDLIRGHQTSETQEKQDRPSPIPPTDGMSLPEPDILESPDPLSRRQSPQRLLGPGPGPRSAEPETPVESAKALPPAPVESARQAKPGTPSLAVYCLGPFRVYQDDQLVTNWLSGKGKCIFKYMIAHRGRPISKDILMDRFWRDADPEAARNNLNVAIYGLRQALRAARPNFSHILFQDDHYLLNPALAVWVDVEEFVQRYEAGQSFKRRGKLAEAMGEYEAAEALYQGDFLEEDLYQDWLIPRREGLKDSYLVILDRLSRNHLKEKRYRTCIHLCRKILAKDDCREDAHRRLMRCYNVQGQRNLALRQYHLCVETLARVLDVPPMPETVALYHQIRNGETV
jgi:DNA-binding SARP family transcriptional activator